MLFRHSAFAVLMLLAVVLLRAAARLLTAAHRLNVRPAPAIAPMPLQLTDVVEAPQRYAATMSIGEILDRTVH